jgi:cell division protein FtsL
MKFHKLAIFLVPLLWLAVLGSAAGVVYVRHEARTLFIELERLAADRDRLNIEWGQLQLEQSAWSNHGFVERVSSEKLRMTLPQPVDVRIVTP